ncbi:hypothetical protein [Psychrosphaera algicola]|uniref:hypothetical protein n=1 Tax=Psychrosphaera algicola TaxID=3023714 RepID=UPI00351D136C
MPHGPVAINKLHPDYINREDLTLSEKKYASMVKMLDDHVGLIMQELKVLGMDENTIVFSPLIMVTKLITKINKAFCQSPVKIN